MIGSSDYIVSEGGSISAMFRYLFGGYLYYTLATVALADDRVLQGFDVARELCARYSACFGVPVIRVSIQVGDRSAEFSGFFKPTNTFKNRSKQVR